jgi:hypothetical protein
MPVHIQRAGPLDCAGITASRQRVLVEQIHELEVLAAGIETLVATEVLELSGVGAALTPMVMAPRFSLWLLKAGRGVKVRDRSAGLDDVAN